jgi:hypothetical protein
MNGKCSKCSQWPSGEPPYQPRQWSEKGQNVLASHNCYAYMLNDLFQGPRKYHKPQPGWHYKLRSKNANYNGIKTLNCKETVKGVIKDNPDNLKVLSIKSGGSVVLPPYHYKGILVVSPNNDYHFARQDNRMLKVYSMLIRHGINKLSDQRIIRELVNYSRVYMPEISKYLPSDLKTNTEKARFLYKNSKTWSHKPGSTAVTDKDADGKMIFDPLLANWDFSNKGGINYNKKCCFFSVPMNTHKNTYSTGTPFSSFGASIPNMKTRTNISVAPNQQDLDRRILKILRV